ncbi:MAG: organic hydroperoxide resistance protein [Janthinobacterium lividum]
MEKLYTAQATATGGRNGNVQSSDGAINMEVRMPKELGGKGGLYTNPEQLFAAGYAACFDSALNMIIGLEKVKTGLTTVTADVSIGKNDNGGFGLEIKLEVSIPDIDRATAQQLLEKAHQVCPYSNATRNNVDVELELV